MSMRAVGSGALQGVYDLLIGGVNHSLPGNGGPQCTAFLSIWQRILETAVFVPFCLYLISVSWPLLNVPKRFVINRRVHRYRFLILAGYCVVFGVELGFKFASQTAIFLLNPCHLTTLLQILLLLFDPAYDLTCRAFRVHLYTLPGAVLALIFPVLNSRTLPGEVLIYYVQHLLILIIPLYLMNLGGAYVPEPVTDWAWPVFSFALMLIYHIVPLQFVGMITEVNLNCIICPAISDPFSSRLYRLFGIGHQALFIPLVAKSYSICARALLKYMDLVIPSDDRALEVVPSVVDPAGIILKSE